MKKKTQKEVLAHYRLDRIETAIQEAIRYTRVLHKCTVNEGIAKIKERLDQIGSDNLPPIVDTKE